MRSVVVSLSAVIALSGCATVSMMPGQGTIETSLTQEQSALRQSAEAYIELAESEHWVSKSSSLLGLAKVLVDGVSGDEAKYEYADHIDVQTAPAEQIEARLMADYALATNGLDEVIVEAQSVLDMADSKRETLRSDVTQFEKVLVTAQKTQRSFVEVITLVEDDETVSVAELEAARDIFDLSIDKARKTADRLADLYASTPSATATS